ncbi:unannotated protein [freshwater metagenome]|uniref:Unannotated protein n=1 Tax=freshwater metagenome TaxID=449393 RepID=A0A6J7R6X9_9ZZZZ
MHLVDGEPRRDRDLDLHRRLRARPQRGEQLGVVHVLEEVVVAGLERLLAPLASEPVAEHRSVGDDPVGCEVVGDRVRGLALLDGQLDQFAVVTVGVDLAVEPAPDGGAADASHQTKYDEHDEQPAHPAAAPGDAHEIAGELEIDRLDGLTERVECEHRRRVGRLVEAAGADEHAFGHGHRHGDGVIGRGRRSGFGPARRGRARARRNRGS